MVRLLHLTLIGVGWRLRFVARPTGSARTAVTSASPNVGVLRRELVASDAMRLAGVLRTHPFSAHEVFPLRHHLKVVGVNARPIAAQVVDLHPLRDRSARLPLIGIAVRVNPLLSIPERAIAVSVGDPAPDPA